MIYRLRSLVLDRSSAILLALAMLLAQFGLIAHEIDHQLHKPSSACEMCLAAHHLGSTPIVKNTPLLVSRTAGNDALPANVASPVRQFVASFSARAPPVSLHA
ncbi:MAG: DUF2946 family protein [Pseudomonadota bacterium]